MDKVIDIEDRIPTLKERRRRRTNMKFAVIISLFLGTLFLLLYFQSPYSDIQKIKISGAKLAEDEYYLQKSGLVIGESLWGFKIAEIEDNLQDQWVKNVEVKRKWLNTVEIHIEEFRKVAYIAENHKFYPMLENGIIYKDSKEITPVDAPVFLQFGDEELRKLVLKELTELDDEVLALISQINLNTSSTDPRAITLYMNDGYEVRAEISSLAEKLKYYPSIVAQIENLEGFEKGIIDIEVGSYYKPYSEVYRKLDMSSKSDDDTTEQDVKADDESTSQ